MIGWLAKALGLNWINGVIMAALVAVAAGAGGMAWAQTRIAERLSADLSTALSERDTARAERANCSARIKNIMEARDDAKAVDAPDFTIPDHWLRP
jgi:hypothetical protein